MSALIQQIREFYKREFGYDPAYEKAPYPKQPSKPPAPISAFLKPVDLSPVLDDPKRRPKKLPQPVEWIDD